ncbi:MAG: OmpA family protein [Alphaproteobacteria bacterium]
MRHVLLLGVCAAALIPALPALARDSSQDAAYDQHSQPIYNSNGNCVRTRWQENGDPCAPAVQQVQPQVVVQAPPPPPVLPEVSEEQRTVYFAFNSSGLDADAKAKLDQLAQIINGAKSINDVVIHGYTDQLGTTSYNDVLANKRAAAVKKYLDTESRLSSEVGDVRGIGKSAPEAQCVSIKKRADKISCMAKERRVEVEFKATK